MQGSAAAKHDALKYQGQNGHHHPGYTFIPASVESYGYLGKLLVRYLNTLSEAATRGPAVTKGSLLAGAHRELSVALSKCQGSLYCPCSDLLVRAVGRQVSPGVEVPYMRTDIEESLVTLLLALGAVGQLLVPLLRAPLRSRIAPVLEILHLAPLSIVTKHTQACALQRTGGCAGPAHNGVRCRRGVWLGVRQFVLVS